MKISSSALSDRGRQRTENEDAFLTDQELQLYVVCDGMGGHLAGAEASQMATRVVRSEIGKYASTIQKNIQSLEVAARHQVSKVLEEAVAAANAAIFAAAREDPTKRGMGTTLELLLVAADTLLFCTLEIVVSTLCEIAKSTSSPRITLSWARWFETAG